MIIKTIITRLEVTVDGETMDRIKAEFDVSYGSHQCETITEVVLEALRGIGITEQPFKLFNQQNALNHYTSCAYVSKRSIEIAIAWGQKG